MSKIVAIIEAEGVSEEELKKQVKAILRYLQDAKPGMTVEIKTARTEKQVISGYHRPVCIKCHCELRPDLNGIGVLDMADWEPYELYAADIWGCPKCGVQIAGGFALNPISAHYEPRFQEIIDSYATRGLLIRNSG